MSLGSIVAKIKKERPKNYGSFFHGIDHWERVHANGLKLCKYFEADSAVIRYFAYLHDSCRWNEDIDPEHGPRASMYIDKLREDIDLDDDQIKLLKKACSGHTHAKPGTQAGLDLTLACCWNADRLDIERVGLTLDPKYLFTSNKTELAHILACKSV
jgi:uncharacterized protein